MRRTLQSLLARLTPDQRKKALTDLPNQIPSDLVTQLAFDWRGIWARDKQLPPDGNWVIWLILAGRGFGKTRTGAEWIQERVESGEARRIIIAGATAEDLRDIQIEGESGILAVAPPWCRPVYIANKNRLIWPNGAQALCITAEKPDRFRGKQCDTFWGDEIASWRYPEAWDQLQLGFRLGSNPRGIVTTTPRPIPLVRNLLAREGRDVVVTRGTTYENRANLADAFYDQIIRQYEGTRLGRQELNAEVLDDNPGALWHMTRIDELRVDSAPELRRVVVAIDPAVSHNADSDETGIVVAGVGDNGHGYVLDDVSGIYTPEGWRRKVGVAYHRHHADRVVAEVNNGGDLVEANLRAGDGPRLPFLAVHASRGKAVRAEPVAALYEQGRVHHVGCFPRLEDQMCTWDPTCDAHSPDRVDALVWALTNLMVGGVPARPQPWKILPRNPDFADDD